MRWRGILGSLALVVATVAAAEIVVRAFTWMPSSPERIDDGIGGQRYAFYPAGVGDLVPGQDGHWLIWHHRPYHVQTNSLGLRSSEEPIAGAMRILATGDSQTFGPYVANEDAWPGWLQARLRQAGVGGRPVQVFNAGVSGYSIADQLDWLKDKAVAFKPDLVVLAVFENDVLDMRKYLAGTRLRREMRGDRDDRMTRYWIKRVRKAIGENSALYTLVKDSKTAAAMREAGVDPRRGEGDATLRRGGAAPDGSRLAELYAATFAEFVATARGAGIPIAVVAIPDADAIGSGERGEVATLVRALASAAALPFLDLHDAFAARPDATQSLYLLQWESAAGGLRGNGHLSREGHRVVGHHVAEWLRGLEPRLQR